MSVSVILEGLSNNREEVAKKNNEYTQYIINHIANVREAYDTYFLPMMSTSDKEFKDAIIQAGIYVSRHDISKYSKEEFPWYRAKYFPTESEKNDKYIDSMIDKAWEHHYLNNPHHPRYWCADGVKRDMELAYIIEMFCDWIAMSKYFNSSTVKWYETDAQDEKDCFTEKTKNIVEDILYNKLGGNL